MPTRHFLLGLLVTVVWGLNFSLIKIAEGTFNPLLLATLRFILCCIPAIFFFRRPMVHVKYLIAYGLVFGVFQFGLLFAGIKAGMSPGLASVVLQLQVFFTILFGATINHERISRNQVFGISLGFAGVALLASNYDGTVSIPGLVLVASAGLSWGLANVIAKNAQSPDPLAFMIWSSIIPILPLIGLTFVIEGYESIVNSFGRLSWGAAGAVLYLVYPTTLFGYSVWNGLMRKYKTSLVAPLTLLVPVFGMIGSKLIFNEKITILGVVAASLMILGLAVNQFGGSIIRHISRKQDVATAAAPLPARSRLHE